MVSGKLTVAKLGGNMAWVWNMFKGSSKSTGGTHVKGYTYYGAMCRYCGSKEVYWEPITYGKGKSAKTSWKLYDKSSALGHSCNEYTKLKAEKKGLKPIHPKSVRVIREREEIVHGQKVIVRTVVARGVNKTD